MKAAPSKSPQKWGFTPAESRLLRRLDSPIKIQRYLDSLPYHLANTAWSPRHVMLARTAHCLEGAIFAAAALRFAGHPPLLWDLEAERDTDHVLAIFRVRGRWGALGTSNYAGCRYREPVYASLRELAMSYFDGYFNLRGERTLRAFSGPVSLARFDRQGWMTAEDEVWYIAEHLVHIPHRQLLTPAMARGLHRLDARSLAAGMSGHRRH
jgi:hypothetical protein